MSCFGMLDMVGCVCWVMGDGKTGRGGECIEVILSNRYRRFHSARRQEMIR